MRTLVHLSDLHFGRVDPLLLTPLAECVHALSPDVVVVSGDLTQRARSAEFLLAKEFLERLPGPRVVVPGNHDVPLHNLAARLLRPLEKFRRYIEPSLSPSFIDPEIAVFGVNTARSLVVKNGRISEVQVRELREAFNNLGEVTVKVVVTHHPFDVPSHADAAQLVGRAGMAMSEFARCGVDVLLAGHLHAGHGGDTGGRYALAGYGALALSAGTATSTRGRGEANSFNLLRLEKHRVELERFEWVHKSQRFSAADHQLFVREHKGWKLIDHPLPEGK